MTDNLNNNGDAWTLAACPVCAHRPQVDRPPAGLDKEGVFCAHHVITLFDDSFATHFDDAPWAPGAYFDELLPESAIEDDDRSPITIVLEAAGDLLSTPALDDAQLGVDVGPGMGFMIRSFYATDEASAQSAQQHMAAFVRHHAATSNTKN